MIIFIATYLYKLSISKKGIMQKIPFLLENHVIVSASEASSSSKYAKEGLSLPR
jgi:hypothetical protein